jgi:aspartate carbamoyltransferase catalytic subunit
MTTNLRSVTVKLQSSLFEQIRMIAMKRGETISDTIRHFISRGLDERVYQENTALISQIVREQMEQVLRTQLISQAPGYLEHPQQDVAGTVDPRRLTVCRKIS